VRLLPGGRRVHRGSRVAGGAGGERGTLLCHVALDATPAGIDYQVAHAITVRFRGEGGLSAVF
jgi:hypothetical protein